MTRIETATEARSLDDIAADWKIVARNAVWGWDYLGDITHKALHALAAANPPRLSTVTGRGAGGRLCLYARVPPALKKIGKEWRAA